MYTLEAMPEESRAHKVIIKQFKKIALESKSEKGVFTSENKYLTPNPRRLLSNAVIQPHFD